MRITKKVLEAKVDRLNALTKSPEQTIENGKFNIDNYTLDCAYGGYSLHRIMNEGGGVNDVFQVGHVPARKLGGLIDAYIAGIYDHGQVS